MDIGNIPKGKPVPRVDAPATNGLPDFNSMNPNMFQFPFSMFPGMMGMNQMGGMNGMSGMNGMQFPNFGLPFLAMMNQQAPVGSSSRHSNSFSSKKAHAQPMITLDKYDDEKLLKEKFECLRDMNDPKFKVANVKDAEFFITRSSNDDDLHKVEVS